MIALSLDWSPDAPGGSRRSHSLRLRPAAAPPVTSAAPPAATGACRRTRCRCRRSRSPKTPSAAARSTSSIATRRSSRCSSSSTAPNSTILGRAVVAGERRAAEEVLRVGDHGRGTRRRARHRRIQPGARRAARGRGQDVPRVARASRPIACEPSATGRSSPSIPVTTKRRGRRTGAPTL